MREITLDYLKRLTPEQRANLYENARTRREHGGQAVMDAIDQSGLPLRSGGITRSDPVYLKMEEIIWSPAGRTAALHATSEGLPALAGVEPMLKAALGQRYQPHDMGTVAAGSIVGELMRHLGYVRTGPASMPANSVATTAMTWKPRS